MSSDPAIPDDREPLAIHVVLLVAISGVLVSNIALTLLRRAGHRWLPPASVSVMCGLAVGSLIRLRYALDPATRSGGVPYELGFDGPIFFLLLLPIINFDSGMSLQRKPFFDQLFSILTLSIGGTLIAALIMGVLIHAGGAAGVTIPLSFEESMALAAILAATDGLTVGGILDELNAPPRLVALVLGEGSANDAVSIVLYNTFAVFMDRSKSGDSSAAPQETAAETMSRFLSVLVGSITIGTGISAIATFIFRVVYKGYVPAAWMCCCSNRYSTSRTRLSGMSSITGNGTNGGGGDISPSTGSTVMSDSQKESQALLSLRRVKELGNNSNDSSSSGSSSQSQPNRTVSSSSTTNATAATHNNHNNKRSSSSFLYHSPLTTIDHEETLLVVPVFLVLVGYTSYMIAESLTLSGVVAVLFAGIGLNYFVLPILHPAAKKFALHTSRSLSACADTAVFFQVGLDIALTLGTRYGIDTKQDIVTLVVSILTVLFSRAVAIFPLTGLINYLRRDPIPLGWQVQLVHSGLRGAGTYAFALVWPSENRELVIDITAGVVLTTALLLGLTTVPMMRLTGCHVTEGNSNSSSSGARFGTSSSDSRSSTSTLSVPLLITDSSSTSSPMVSAAITPMVAGLTSSSPGNNETSAGGELRHQTSKSKNYTVKIVHEARVYLPLSTPTASMRAVSWLSSISEIIRWWVSGIKPLTEQERTRRLHAVWDGRVIENDDDDDEDGETGNNGG